MRDNSFSKTMVFSFLVLGLLAGILLVIAMDDSGQRYYRGAGAFLALAVFFIAVRVYLAKLKKAFGKTRDIKDSSEVGFVVDTFHELVAKLKEKEAELEKLRGLAEEKAVRIEAYNENILQSIPSGVITIDNLLKIKSMNHAAGRILGLDPRGVIEKDISDIFNEPLISLIADADGLVRQELPYVTLDKRHVWLGITTSWLINASNEKIGLIFIFTDLTDVKALQAQVELKQRLSQLGEMSAGISHELRNSMSVISGYAKLLGKKVEESNKPTVDSIIAEISSMDRVISELLAFAKPAVLSMERTDLVKTVKEAAGSVIAEGGPVRASIDSEDDLFVKADDILLKQALSNILINAVDAMPRGGEIIIKLTRMRDKAELIIRDTGPGMPAEIVKKIFLPFFTTRPEGVGLGLALVQKIMVAHGGGIEVVSKEGEGTTFIITLPLDG